MWVSLNSVAHVIWFHSGVCLLLLLKTILHAGSSAASPHRCQVSSGVLGKVVTTHEAAEAHWAGKLFFSRVGSAMPGQLIGASETPLATLPLAFIRFLTCWIVEAGIRTFLNILQRVKHLLSWLEDHTCAICLKTAIAFKYICVILTFN